MEESEEVRELSYQSDGVVLPRGYTKDVKEIQEFLRIKAEIEGKLERDEPVYVQILDERRKGSVGRLGKIQMVHTPDDGRRSYYWGSYGDYFGVSGIEVVWDKRKNKCQPYVGEVEYLPNWTQGTHWEWTPGEAKEKPPRVIPYDHLGQEIEPGQFVCFVHRRYGNISMKFGTVTRLTDKGGVFVKSLKLRDNEKAGDELKALAAEDLVIVNDTLMSRLVMARLAAQ